MKQKTKKLIGEELYNKVFKDKSLNFKNFLLFVKYRKDMIAFKKENFYIKHFVVFDEVLEMLINEIDKINNLFFKISREFSHFLHFSEVIEYFKCISKEVIKQMDTYTNIDYSILLTDKLADFYTECNDWGFYDDEWKERVLDLLFYFVMSRIKRKKEHKYIGNGWGNIQDDYETERKD